MTSSRHQWKGHGFYILVEFILAPALSSYAREHLGVPPDSGVVLVFRSRRPGRVKVLFHDGSGMVLVAKWPDRGSFRWPPVSEGLLRLSRVEFSALFDVCDWRGLKAPRRAVRG